MWIGLSNRQAERFYRKCLGGTEEEVKKVHKLDSAPPDLSGEIGQNFSKLLKVGFGGLLKVFGPGETF